MALVPIINQSWDTNSIFNPTRMNNIENNIAIAATAEGTEYSNGVSVKDKIDAKIEVTTQDLSITTGSSLYGGFYYGASDILNNTDKIIAYFPYKNNISNALIMPVLLNNGQIRIFSPEQNYTATIRVIRKQ